MPDQDGTDEPLLSLPPGMAWRYAEYNPAPNEPSPAPTNVGGYGELLNYCRGKDAALPRSLDGLVAIDSLVENSWATKELHALGAPLACSTETSSLTLSLGPTGRLSKRASLWSG